VLRSQVALAQQIGFLRMIGRLLEAVRILPPALWRHLGEQFGVADTFFLGAPHPERQGRPLPCAGAPAVLR
jgi:hypothetical protein